MVMAVGSAPVGCATRGTGCWGSWRWIRPQRGRGEGRKRKSVSARNGGVEEQREQGGAPGLAGRAGPGWGGGRKGLAPSLPRGSGSSRGLQGGGRGAAHGPQVTRVIPTCPEGTHLGHRRRNRVLQRRKRAEGPEGSPKPQKGSGLGVQTCPRGHSSLQTPNLSLTGASSRNHYRLCSSQPQAAEPSAIPGHTCPTRVPQCPTRVPHVSLSVPQCPTCVPHADCVALAHAEPQHKARGNQTPPLLAKPSGDPSPPQPPCQWDSGGILVGWMGHMDVTQLEGDGLQGRSCHAVETRWVA